MMITGRDANGMKNLEETMFKEFKMWNLGKLKYFLGIEVLRFKVGIFISQRKYVLDLLAKTRMINCKPAELQ